MTSPSLNAQQLTARTTHHTPCLPWLPAQVAQRSLASKLQLAGQSAIFVEGIRRARNKPATPSDSFAARQIIVLPHTHAQESNTEKFSFRSEGSSACFFQSFPFVSWSEFRTRRLTSPCGAQKIKQHSAKSHSRDQLVPPLYLCAEYLHLAMTLACVPGPPRQARRAKLPALTFVAVVLAALKGPVRAGHVSSQLKDDVHRLQEAALSKDANPVYERLAYTCVSRVRSLPGLPEPPCGTALDGQTAMTCLV